MKLSAIIMLAAFLEVSVSGYAQGITLSEKNTPLVQVLRKIEKQSGFLFSYNDALIKRALPVNIEVNNVSITTALDLVLKDQPLSFSITGKMVVIKQGPSPVLRIDIKGRVIDVRGDPVEGATVTVKGTTLSTNTDMNGRFRLGIEDRMSNAVLEFTYISMRTVEMAADGKNDLQVVLAEKHSEMSDVVVNDGYRTVRGEIRNGSIARLDSIGFHRRPGMAITERLDGNVVGVLFNKKGSSFNSPILIRGISTLGSNNTSTAPLIIVDNFPVPDAFNLNNINPNDVDNITVLKDAASASIWGSRAGNGVIVITTKRGKYDQVFQLDFSSNLTIEEKPDLDYYPRISASDFIGVERFLYEKGFYNLAISNTTTRPVISEVVEILGRRDAGIYSENEAESMIDALKRHDIKRELDKYVYRNATRQQYYLGFSGGNKKLAYQGSFGFNKNLNNIQRSKGADQYTISGNTSYRPIRKLEIQTSVYITSDYNHSYNFNLPTPVSPYTKLVDENGDARAIPYLYRKGYIDSAGGGNLLDWHYSPLNEIRWADNSLMTRFRRFNINLSYNFFDKLKAVISYQYLSVNVDVRNHHSLQNWETRNLINRFTNPYTTDPALRYPVPMGGILDVTSSLSRQHHLRGQLNYNGNYSGGHSITAMLAGEISDSKGGFKNIRRLYGYDKTTGNYTKDINYDTAYRVYFAAAPMAAFQIPNYDMPARMSVTRFVSLLSNISYSYKDRYSLYLSARKDGANIYGVNTNNKWKPLWAVSAGWNISKETFYKIGWMPHLRVKASYGNAGNSNNTLSGLFLIRYASARDEITGLPFAWAGRMPNSDLRWEEVRIMNAGIDFRLFQNRIAGSVEIFHKRSRDVIFEAPSNPSTGVNSYVLNNAAMKTSGYEITFNSRNTRGAVEWTTTAGWSYARTVVTKVGTSLGKRVSDFFDYKLTPVAGQTAYGIASYRWAGLDPLTGDPQGILNKAVSKDYFSIFNDSVHNQVFHGSALPLGSFFLRNNLSWKRFTITSNLSGRFNYYFREPALSLHYTASMTGTSYAEDYNRRWQTPGDEAKTNVPSMLYPVTSSIDFRDQFYQNAEIHVKRADNIRMQDIGIAYQWNTKTGKWAGLKTVSLYLYANNLNIILWRAEHSRYDPDFSGGAGDGTVGPTPKTITMGATLNF